jgi:hypothetical protein
MVASYTSSNTYIFDVESAKEVLKLDTKQSSGKNHCAPDSIKEVSWYKE